MSESQNLPAVRPTVTAGGPVGALVPQTIDEAWRLSEAFARAKILPRGITDAPQVMLIICGGAEVGFGPFQSLQSFYLVNNRLTLWGDAIPALLWSNGFKLREWFENADPNYPDNMVAKCVVTRPDGQEIEGEFSVSDAKEAKLWTKDGPWQTARKRMLKMRARAFAARDGAPDVLRGVGIREEVEDYDLITEVRSAPQPLSVEFEDKPARRRRAADKAAATEERPTWEEANTVTAGAPAAESQQDTSASATDAPIASAAETSASTERPLEAGPEPEEEGEQRPPVRPIADGYPDRDEVYFLTGDEWFFDQEKNSWLRDCFKNGEPFSTVGEKALYATYEDHAPETTGDVQGAEVEEDADPELDRFIDEVEAADSWGKIKQAMAWFFPSPAFAKLNPDEQAAFRAKTWEFASKLGDVEDHAMSPTAFRLWIEHVDDADAIHGTLAVLEKQPAFDKMQPGQKDGIRRAVAGRIERLTS